MKGNKKRKNKGRVALPKVTKPPESPIKKANPWWAFIKRFWRWVVFISVIIGLILDYQPIKNLFLSPHDKYEQDAFRKGILSPDRISNGDTISYNTLPQLPDFSYNKKSWQPLIPGIKINFNADSMLRIFIGQYNFLCPKSILEKGVRLHLPNTCDTTSLFSLGVKDDKIYVSAQFDDLQKEETVGFISFNHWNLYKPNMFDYQTDYKHYLQVEDLKNNVIFSIHYWKANGIFIAGYFLEPHSVTIIPNFRYGFDHISCYLKNDPGWKNNAFEDIKRSIVRVDTLKYAKY